jgi:hypothetical protein
MDTVGEPGVAPRGPSRCRYARRRLPSSGSLGLRFPTFPARGLRYYEPLRLPMAHLGVVRFSLSFPDPLYRASGFVSLGHPRLVCKASASLPRRESFPCWAALLRLIYTQGDHGLSHVPESPLWKHAPLSDPGGVLHTRRIASRTAAFRSLHTVGFGLDPAEAILLTTPLHIAGLHDAACILVPSSFVRP